MSTTTLIVIILILLLLGGGGYGYRAGWGDEAVGALTSTVCNSTRRTNNL